MKTSSFLKPLVLAAALATVGVAGAADVVINWGNMSPGATTIKEFSQQHSGSFVDTYNFSLSSVADAGLKRSVVVTYDTELPGLLSGFTDLTYKLYNGSTLVNSSSYSSSTKILSYDDLSVGNYSLKVTGTAWAHDGADNPLYKGRFTIAAAPVPEPETYAMFLAGLGIMGAVARRRSQRV